MKNVRKNAEKSQMNTWSKTRKRMQNMRENEEHAENKQMQKNGRE